MEIKNRLTLLNVVRLAVGVSLVGEAIHSDMPLFGVIGLLLLVQVVMNKKCSSSGCVVEE